MKSSGLCGDVSVVSGVENGKNCFTDEGLLLLEYILDFISLFGLLTTLPSRSSSLTFQVIKRFDVPDQSILNLELFHDDRCRGRRSEHRNSHNNSPHRIHDIESTIRDIPSGAGIDEFCPAT